MPFLPNTGSNLAIICGYIRSCRQQYGDEWYDQWVDRQLHQKSWPIRLIFKIAIQCGATSLVAQHIIKILKI